MNELTLTYDEWIEAAKERTYRYSVPMASGATLQCEGEKIVGRTEAPALVTVTIFRDTGYLTRVGASLQDCLRSAEEFYSDWGISAEVQAWMFGSIECDQFDGAMAESIAAGRKLEWLHGKIVAHGVELVPLPVKTIADLFRTPAQQHKPADPSAQRDAQHKPLPVQGRSPFDPFKDCDFTVTRGNNDGIGFAGKSAHPLQRFTSADQI